MGWLSEMGDDDFRYNPTLVGIYRAFETKVCAIHDGQPPPNTTVHGLVPVDRGVAFRPLVVQRRAHQGGLDALAQTKTLRDIVQRAVSDKNFLRMQMLQLRLFPLGGDRSRFFISMVSGNNVPPAFHNHLSLRLTSRVESFYDESTHAHFKWNPVTKTKTLFMPLLPFWDTQSNGLCVLGNHEEYFRLMAAHARTKTLLASMPKGPAVESSDAQLRGQLKEREGELMERIRSILQFHVHAYDAVVGGFVSTSWHLGVRQREEHALVLDETIVRLRAAAVEETATINRIKDRERADAAAKSEELARYERELVLLEGREAEEMQSRIWGVESYQERMLVSIAETETLELMPIRKRLEGIERAMFDAEDECAQLRSATAPLFDAGVKLVHNLEQGRYEWLCPQNSQMYHLKTELASEVTLSGQFERGAVRWLRVDNHPVWDAATESFGTAETWVVPGGSPPCHCYMDYDRVGWEFRAPVLGWVRRLTPFQSHFAEVACDTTVDALWMHVEATHGLQHGQFRITAKHMEDLAQQEFRMKEGVCVLYIVPIQCAADNHWKGGAQETDGSGNLLERNTNERGKREDKRGDREDTRDRAESSKQGWSRDVMDLITGRTVANNNNVTGSVMRDEFDYIRFFFLYAGEPNGIAEDFGSGGHYCSWENPIIVFRESWFMLGPDTGSEKLWAIPRVPFHFDITESQLIPPPLVANPTGVHCQNIERYWGYDMRGKNPALRMRLVSFRDASRPPISDGRFPLSTKSVPDMKNLLQQRTHMFYEWIHDPHNWYWDSVGKRFCVFAFSPDMVFVQRGSKTHLVQQLSVYYVDQLYPGEAHADFVAAMKRYRDLRRVALAAWNAAEATVPMPGDLRTRVDKEVKRLWETAPVPGKPPAFSPRACTLVGAHFDGVVRHVERSLAVQYYGFIRRHFQSPHGAPPCLSLAPTTPGEAVRMLGQRQLTVRGLFWRLFQDKFGVPYHTFLTSQEVRTRVFARVPELMGPSHDVSFKPDAGLKFLAAWASEPRETEGAFADFFASYPDFKVYDMPWLAKGDFPHAPPAAVDDPNALEDWYWGEADVLPDVRGQG